MVHLAEVALVHVSQPTIFSAAISERCGARAIYTNKPNARAIARVRTKARARARAVVGVGIACLE